MDFVKWEQECLEVGMATHSLSFHEDVEERRKRKRIYKLKKK